MINTGGGRTKHTRSRAGRCTNAGACGGRFITIMSRRALQLGGKQEQSLLRREPGFRSQLGRAGGTLIRLTEDVVVGINVIPSRLWRTFLGGRGHQRDRELLHTAPRIQRGCGCKSPDGDAVAAGGTCAGNPRADDTAARKTNDTLLWLEIAMPGDTDTGRLQHHRAPLYCQWVGASLVPWVAPEIGSSVTKSWGARHHAPKKWSGN